MTSNLIPLASRKMPPKKGGKGNDKGAKGGDKGAGKKGGKSEAPEASKEKKGGTSSVKVNSNMY